MSKQTIVESIATLRDKLTLIESDNIMEKGLAATLLGKGLDALAHSGGAKLPPKIPTKTSWMRDMPEPAGGGGKFPARAGDRQAMPGSGGAGGKIPPNSPVATADFPPDLPGGAGAGDKFPIQYTHSGEYIGKDIPKNISGNKAGQTIDGEFRTINPEVPTKGGMPATTGDLDNLAKGGSLPGPKGSNMPDYDPFTTTNSKVPFNTPPVGKQGTNIASNPNISKANPYNFPVPAKGLPHNSTPIGNKGVSGSGSAASTASNAGSTASGLGGAAGIAGLGAAANIADKIPGVTARMPKGGSSLWGATGLAGALAGGAGGYALGKHDKDQTAAQQSHSTKHRHGHTGGHTGGHARRGNPEIAKWQELLNANGANIKVDGIYGPETQAAYDKIFPKFQKEQTMAESIRDLQFKLDIL